MVSDRESGQIAGVRKDGEIRAESQGSESRAPADGDPWEPSRRGPAA